MTDIRDASFTKLLNAYPNSIDAGSMRGTYLEAWAKVAVPVITRTVDYFLEHYQRCPSLDEFMEQAEKEKFRQQRSNRRLQIENCRACDHGWILADVTKDSYKPCESCLPETFESWATGAYLPN